MEEYEIVIFPKVEKELNKLEKKDWERVDQAILKLKKNPEPIGSIKLTGYESWRIRVGKIRIIYTYSEIKKEIIIERIGHRKDVYK